MYKVVRFQLGIPFHIETRERGRTDSMDELDDRSLGAMLSVIHGAIQNGTLYICHGASAGSPAPAVTVDKFNKCQITIS